MAEFIESERRLDTISIFQKRIPAAAPVKANLILVHGVGEHCGRYDALMRKLSEHHFAVTAFDQPGHGKSGEKRGVLAYEQTWQLINEIKKELHDAEPDTPIFVYGHSMGGAIVLSYGYRYPELLKGIIAASPGLGLAKPFPPIVVSLMSGLAKIAPKMTIPNGLPLDGLSHDQAVIDRYKADPLVHDRVSMRLGMDLIRKGEGVLAETKPFPLPLLLLQGSADSLVSVATVEKFAAKAGANVQYRRIEGGYHELHNETPEYNDEQIIMDWLEDQLAKYSI